MRGCFSSSSSSAPIPDAFSAIVTAARPQPQLGPWRTRGTGRSFSMLFTQLLRGDRPFSRCFFFSGGGRRPGEPLVVARVRPADELEVLLLQLRRHRAALPFADDAVVDLADRRDLGGRAREENLVRL